MSAGVVATVAVLATIVVLATVATLAFVTRKRRECYFNHISVSQDHT